MLRRNLIRKSSAALVTLTVMLGVAEGVVRAFVPARNVGPSFTVFDAERGVALKRNLECQRITPEFTMTLSTNSLGQRGAEPSSKAAGGVLFLGDSFTLGYGVDDGQEFPALVRAALSSNAGEIVPTWNTGVGGVGNGRWLKVLDNEALAWEPSIVVMQICGNDFDDNWSEGLYSITEAGELTAANSEKAPTLKRALQSFVEFVPGLSYSHLVCSFRGGRRRTQDDGVAVAQEGDELTWRIIEEAISKCQARGQRVVLVTAAVGESRLKRANELGIPVLTVPLKSERPDLYYERDGHWNALGHEYAAELLTRELIE